MVQLIEEPQPVRLTQDGEPPRDEQRKIRVQSRHTYERTNAQLYVKRGP